MLRENKEIAALKKQRERRSAQALQLATPKIKKFVLMAETRRACADQLWEKLKPTMTPKDCMWMEIAKKECDEDFKVLTDAKAIYDHICTLRQYRSKCEEKWESVRNKSVVRSIGYQAHIDGGWRHVEMVRWEDKEVVVKSKYRPRKKHTNAVELLKDRFQPDASGPGFGKKFLNDLLTSFLPYWNPAQLDRAVEKAHSDCVRSVFSRGNRYKLARKPVSCAPAQEARELTFPRAKVRPAMVPGFQPLRPFTQQPEQYKTLPALYRACEKIQDSFSGTVESVETKLAAALAVSVRPTYLKTAGQCFYEFMYDFEENPRDITDINRGTITFRDIASLYNALPHLCIELSVERVEDGFEAKYASARELRVKARLNDMLVELQLQIDAVAAVELGEQARTFYRVAKPFKDKFDMLLQVE